MKDSSPSWPPPTGGDRDGQPRYLYLTHPQINGSRQREYIGTISPTCTYVDMHMVTAQASARAQPSGGHVPLFADLPIRSLSLSFNLFDSVCSL